MSIAMKLAVRALHLRARPLASAEAIAREVDRERVDAAVPAKLTRTHDVVHSDAHGLPVVTLTPKNTTPIGELFYLHGGAYVHPLVKPHWDIVDHLVRKTPMRVTVPLYALAPEHTSDEAFPRLHLVYDRLTGSGLPLVLAGDSAGGALAMACTLRARDEHRTAPAAVLLFSPWVDASMTNPAIADIEPRDPMLGSAGLVWAAKRWARDRPTTDPWISPINDGLRGLPPIAVFQGGVDIFAPDARLFAEKATAAGSRCDLHLYPDAFHVFVGLPVLPEARDALAKAGELIAAATAG